MDRQLRSTPCPAPLVVNVSQPWVLPHATAHGVVLLAGLFPHDRLSQLILVEDDFLPTGYGTRPLTRPESGDLWDIPILLKDLLATDKVYANSSAALLRSPPTKILFLGGDALVSSWLRGAGASRKRQRLNAVALGHGADKVKVKRQRTKAGMEGGRHGTRRRTLTQLDNEVMTCGTGSSSLELGLEQDSLFRIGRWITDEDEIKEVSVRGSSLPIDVTFILE